MNTINKKEKWALIVVDMQNDFCEGGSLAVDGGNSIVEKINEMMTSPLYDVIVATQDFHPADHSSFISNNPNGIWPDHCVQGSLGVEFHPNLNVSKITKVFQKGMNSAVDSYSGFFDNDKKTSTGMGEWLKEQKITHVRVVGLALDYCVKATAEDAHRLGFYTVINKDATRAVNVKDGDGLKAISELESQGIVVE